MFLLGVMKKKLIID